MFRFGLVSAVGFVACGLLWGAFGAGSAIAFGVPYGLIMSAVLMN